MSTQRRELTTTQFNFTPTTLKEAIEYATIFANSGLCPEAYKGRPNDVLICWQMGAEMGLGKMQAIRSIYCVNGTPSTYGDGQFALVKQHKDFEDANEWMEGTIKDGTRTAFCTLTRKGQTPQTRKFSMEDAKLAGLWGVKDNWKRYPDNMLKRRARTICGKDVFPEATFGLPTQDEAEEMVQINQSKLKPISKTKGMAGLEESLGITEPEVIETEMVDFEVISSNEESEIENSVLEEIPIEELKRLIRETNISGKALNGWLKKAKVSRLEDLSDDHIQQGIQFLKTKEKM